MNKHLRPMFDPDAPTMGPWRGHLFDVKKCTPGHAEPLRGKPHWCRCKANQ